MSKNICKADEKHLESNARLLKHYNVWLKAIETFQIGNHRTGKNVILIWAGHCHADSQICLMQN